MKRLRALFQRSDTPEPPQPPLTLPVSLDDPAVFADPYPIYARLRQEAPVAEVAQGGFLLTRQSDILRALGNSDLGNAPSRMSALAARNAEKYTAASLAANIPPFLDGERHGTVRRDLMRAFHGVLKGFERRLPELAREHVQRAPHAGDLEAEIASPYVLAAMAAFVGLPELSARYAQFSAAFFHLFAPIRDPKQFQAVNETLAAFRFTLAEAQPRASEGSLLHTLNSLGMSEQETIDNAILIFADGVENIQAAAATLLVHRDKASLFETTDAFVHEVLRWDTPGQIIPRVAISQTQVGSHIVPPGVPVYLALGSANRDPEAWEHPDDIRPSRPLNKALIFGRGRHACVGTLLGRGMLTAMVDAFNELDVRADGGPTGYAHRIGHRWPQGQRYVKG